MKIDFEFETQYGKFADALYLDDGVIYTEEEITVMKQERLDNWVAFVIAPPTPKSKYQKDGAGNLILDENGDPISTGV